MDAFEFITGGGAKDVLSILASAQCKSCGGMGECNDAEAGDIFHNTWVCPSCEGKGWNRQAVREIITHSRLVQLTTREASMPEIK